LKTQEVIVGGWDDVDIIGLMSQSNSENNVTAQVFVPLAKSDEGARLMGEWLTGIPESRVLGATFFWFPLRDAIANYYHNRDGPQDLARWPGYKCLFRALGFPEETVDDLPSGHPKNRAWRPRRQCNFHSEVIAELASTELDAAFHVEVGGRQHLFLTEVKWLSPLGAGLHGLNQVQRSVALALWLKQCLSDSEVTYLVCSKQERETYDRLQSDLNQPSWEGMPESFELPEFAVHLKRAIEDGRVKLLAKSWECLAIATEGYPSLSAVNSFLRGHGQERRYRGHSAALIDDSVVQSDKRTKSGSLDRRYRSNK
jgi:hypothetical protein